MNTPKVTKPEDTPRISTPPQPDPSLNVPEARGSGESDDHKGQLATQDDLSGAHLGQASEDRDGQYTAFARRDDNAGSAP